MYDQWRDSCPACGCNKLLVVEVVLVAAGKKFHPGTLLKGDGFLVDPFGELDHLKDHSTEDEVILCPACREEFGLEDLELGDKDEKEQTRRDEKRGLYPDREDPAN